MFILRSAREGASKERMWNSTAAKASPANRVTLHVARISGGFQNVAFAPGGGNAAERPWFGDCDLMAAPLQLADGLLRHARLERQAGRMRSTRPERGRYVIGVEHRAVDRFLQIHTVMHM